MLTNERVVVTGKLESMTRNDLHKLIVYHSGSLGKSVSSTTTILVVGELVNDSETIKIKKAKELGVRVMTEDEFLGYIHY
jgi:DNA ligase (NAD+)